MSWRKTWALVKADVAHRVARDGDELTPSNFARALCSPAGLSVALFRLQSHCHHNGWIAPSKLCTLLNIYLFSTEIDPQAEVGGGFVIAHPGGTLIHRNARIGRNCVLVHQCAIGIRETVSRPRGQVRLGDDVVIGPGARVLGPDVTVGDRSRVEANATVLRSVPPDSIAGGVPARATRRCDATVPVPRRVRSIRTVRPSLRQTLSLIRDDLHHRATIDGRPFSRWHYPKLFLNPPALATAIFRAQSFAAGTPAAPLLSLLNVVLFKVEIGARARIGGGFVIGHGNGVAIGDGARLGERCVIFHHNTLADSPVLESDVLLGAGARVVGDVTIGRGSLIGLNATVTGDLPPGSVAAGVPARALRVAAAPAVAHEAHGAPPPVTPPTFRQMLSLIAEDVEHRARLSGKPDDVLYYLKLPLNPALLAVISFRAQCWLRGAGLAIPAKLLAVANISLFTIEISCQTEIGGGLVLAHANGILVGDHTRIGKRCILTLHNSITRGPRSGFDPARDRVVLGDDVFVGMGSRLIGNLTIGDKSVIGANAVVTASAPASSVIAGVPAREVRRARAAREAAR